MQFGTIPTAAALGAILAHGVRAGGQLYRKGRRLSAADITALAAHGVGSVITARLEATDIGEDEAASRLAGACAGPGVRAAAPFTGRANLYAEAAGLALIDARMVDAVNAIGEAITIATLPHFTRVAPRQMLATVKIIPFGAPRQEADAAEALLRARPAVALAPFKPHRLALISTMLPSTTDAILEKGRRALDARLIPLGSEIVDERRVGHAVPDLQRAIERAISMGCNPILIFGASAITDRRDVVPATIEAAGGTVERFGMPVDPGNLLLLARIGGVPVIGLPGCARSPKLNGADFVLWRLLAGLPVTAGDIAGLGVGGLLAEIPLRPQPRDEAPPDPLRAPKIAALVLAAGQSRRMGSNKLLEELHGKPLIRHAVEAARASQCDSVTVVTGFVPDRVEAALAGLDVRVVQNGEFAGGLSTSLRCGVAALPDDCDGVIVLLGDMPGIGAGLIDRLLAAFSPEEGRAICVPIFQGQRGNPVLWARRFFPEMMALDGDNGARGLLEAYGELVAEIDAVGDAVLADIDTPEALAAWRART